MKQPPDAPGHQFPCRFEIKAMGHAEADFSALVVELIGRHCQIEDQHGVSQRESRNGKFVSVRVTITARSMRQLNAIYDELTAHERVLMRL